MADPKESPSTNARTNKLRRPQSLRSGSEPDPRFTLANERTFLAWIRTSMALVAAAVGLEAFVGERIPQILRTPLSVSLLLFAAVLSAMSLLRWLRLERAMRHNSPLPLPGMAVILVVGVVFAALLLAVAVVGGE